MILENQENINNIQNQNIFYRAVIENNDDGGKHGACQVRVLGIHPKNAKRTGKNKGVKTEDLPWAELMGSTSFHGGMSGYGISAVPLKGTWVWVFFDGGDWNRPIIVGLISGTSKKLSPGRGKTDSGFNDPDKKYPEKNRLSEPDQNRIATNRKFSETLIKTIKDKDRDKGIPTVTGKTWNELKELTSTVKYPLNTVFETTGGNIIEYDEGPGGSRMHWFHNTGTYWEVVKEGDFTMKVKRDRYEIVDRDLYRLNKRDEFHTIQRDSEYQINRDRFILVGRHSEETVNKTVKQTYNDTYDLKVSKAATRVYSSTLDEKVSGSVTEKYSAGQTTDAGPSMILKAGIIKLN